MIERNLRRPTAQSIEASHPGDAVELARLNINLEIVRHNNRIEWATLIDRLFKTWAWRIGLVLLWYFNVAPPITLIGLLAPKWSLLHRLAQIVAALPKPGFGESYEHHSSKSLSVQQEK